LVVVVVEKRVEGKCHDDDNGDGVLEGEVTERSVEGCGKVIYMP